ncbi:sphingomyelinase phosphodiesterase D-like isoform X2 [Dendronephthya gigantea]|uniref:sphingomyelinase phosphodiesterase D-like isoform X2 n=1 Tax=Dendronephthya gigantea TaxID=151771 RepID=UPI00106CB4BF|nr:sphingomyelinase phosphodiesterase D-like isoform X2 [Dendronephthya gigantea]
MTMGTSANRKCSRGNVLVFILFALLIGVVIFIALTYAFKWQCDDDENEHTSQTNNPLSFLLFSDIHLDPWYKAMAGDKYCRNTSIQSAYNASYGRPGCDSPLKLLNEVLNGMKSVRAKNITKMDFVMLSGDTCAHGITTNRRKNALGIMKITSQAVKLAFPDIPYFPSIGNNDLPGHYVMPTENDTWYSDLLEIWKDGILCTNCTRSYPTTSLDELQKTFLYGGYYKVSIADGSMTLLVLNSMYWTKSTWISADYFQERANKQIAWLKEQLELANSTGKKVIITSHIPPGIDTFAEKTLWLSNFTELYMDLVANKFSEVVAGQIYAHFHKDSFRFLQADKKNDSLSSYILLMPSVSVVYKNNPNFRIVHLDPDRQAITDYEQFYMNLVIITEFNNPIWQLDYKFSTRYPPTGDDDKVINGKRIKHLSDNLISQTNDSFFIGFISSRQVRYQPDSFSRFKYYCAVTYYSQKDYDACNTKYPVQGG